MNRHLARVGFPRGKSKSDNGKGSQRAHLGTTTKAGSHANRNAGFIRQADEWHWGCRINPAFRWWCQDAPVPNIRLT
jgi:hypothetical protein